MSPTVIPNVFIQQACLGNRHNAAGLWVRRLDALNGFSPYEAWDHPELLLTEAEREANPSMDRFTLVTTRSLIIRAVKPQARGRNTITTLQAPTIGDLPYASGVRDEDPAPAPESPARNGLVSDPKRSRFDLIPTSMLDPASLPARRVRVIDSMLITERQRQKSRHRGRPRSSAFRSRN